MAGKIQLKLKPKAPAAAAAPAAASAAAAPAAGAAPAFAMPAATGGITLELRGATVHVAEVIIKKK
ncbi:MAG: hypothetical protein ACE14P_00750 [Methanotrichaceae archaeon]